MYFIALGAAALAIGLAAWAHRRIPALQAIAALLVLEAIALVFAEVLEPRSTAVLIAIWIVMLVISLATTGSVAAFAFADKKPLAIAATVCWTLWWVMDAVFYIWGIRMTAEPPPGFGTLPCLAGSVGALLLGIAALRHAKQPGAIALVAVLAGFTIVWCLGENWMINVSIGDDADRIHALRRFSNVGYVGWHVVLAVLLWRTAAGNLPPARVVTNRTASP